MTDIEAGSSMVEIFEKHVVSPTDSFVTDTNWQTLLYYTDDSH